MNPRHNPTARAKIITPAHDGSYSVAEARSLHDRPLSRPDDVAQVRLPSSVPDTPPGLASLKVEKMAELDADLDAGRMPPPEHGSIEEDDPCYIDITTSGDDEDV